MHCVTTKHIHCTVFVCFLVLIWINPGVVTYKEKISNDKGENSTWTRSIESSYWWIKVFKPVTECRIKISSEDVFFCLCRQFFFSSIDCSVLRCLKKKDSNTHKIASLQALFCLWPWGSKEWCWVTSALILIQYRCSCGIFFLLFNFVYFSVV